MAGWKGRAQQILYLQGKISELEEKLNGKHKDLLEAKKRDQSQVNCTICSQKSYFVSY